MVPSGRLKSQEAGSGGRTVYSVRVYTWAVSAQKDPARFPAPDVEHGPDNVAIWMGKTRLHHPGRTTPSLAMAEEMSSRGGSWRVRGLRETVRDAAIVAAVARRRGPHLCWQTSSPARDVCCLFGWDQRGALTRPLSIRVLRGQSYRPWRLFRHVRCDLRTEHSYGTCRGRKAPFKWCSRQATSVSQTSASRSAACTDH